MTRPTREQLHGFSPSEFKAKLKLSGHKVPRDFYKYGCVSRRNSRLFRWRWWSEDGFVLDVSCVLSAFDRWANSTEETFDVMERRYTERGSK